MNGLATVYASGLDPLTDVDTDFTEKYTYPATLSFGLSWNPFQALTIASGADYAAYSGSRRYFDYDTTSASLPDVDESADKIDVMVYHLGASYQYNPSWKFFMGIQTDPCPSERHKLMLMDVYQFNQTMTTLGAGYTWNMLDISALYYYNTADKPARGSRSYESSTNAFTLAFGYHFN
jgi:long-subunit fatty acid transport protein